MTERVTENKETKNKYKKMVRQLETDALTIGGILTKYTDSNETIDMMDKAGKSGLRKEITTHLGKLVTVLNKG